MTSPGTLWTAAFTIVMAIALFSVKGIRRWWARGCKACLLELDLDDTASSKTWAHLATPHTCWLGRRRQQKWKNRLHWG